MRARLVLSSFQAEVPKNSSPDLLLTLSTSNDLYIIISQTPTLTNDSTLQEAKSV